MWFYTTGTCSRSEERASLQRTSRRQTPSEMPLFSLQVTRAKPETAPRLVAKQELQLEGRTAASGIGSHANKPGFTHPDQVPREAPAGWASGQPPRLGGNLTSCCIQSCRCQLILQSTLILTPIPISFLFPRKAAARLRGLLSATRSAAASTANLLHENNLPPPNQPRMLRLVSQPLSFAPPAPHGYSLPPRFLHLSSPGLLVSSGEYKYQSWPQISQTFTCMYKSHKSVKLQH